jgi:UPF0176 protein
VIPAYHWPVAIPKILLYYAFTPLADPEAIRLWQHTLCEALGLRGRVLISTTGINGTVGGDLPAVKKYLRRTREYAPFAELDAKWSEGTGNDFPRLRVRVRDELVSFGAPGELRVDERGVLGGGRKLSPTQLHDLVASRGDDVAFFDGRNAFEAAIGRFRDAVVPDVKSTREFVAQLDSGRFDHLKNRPVVTYCTGGIRCEVLSALMVQRGFGEVYQLEGGIARYGEAFGDRGLWEGSLYVFDNRVSVPFSPDAVEIGICHRCGGPTGAMHNCDVPGCREQLVTCAGCAADDEPVRCEAHAGMSELADQRQV